MKQNVEYKCFEKAAYDPKHKDKTDECILHRREIKNSEISFFDFARFIPNNTKIKTEKNFKGVAKVYEYSMIDCKERREITQQEREKCFSNVKNDIHKMVYDTKIKCTDLNILKIENSEKTDQEMEDEVFNIEEFSYYPNITFLSNISIKEQLVYLYEYNDSNFKLLASNQ